MRFLKALICGPAHVYVTYGLRPVHAERQARLELEAKDLENMFRQEWIEFGGKVLHKAVHGSASEVCKRSYATVYNRM